ncbi:MAG: hypothetical protein IH591_18445, partial [Bacteroidales bacterium]|nr:hypothetical protein [Bacteroidales bacterium]
MKNKIRLIPMIAMIAMMVSSVAESQEVSNVSITGSFTVGSEVVAGYIIQGTATDTIFQWYEVNAVDTSLIGADNQKLTIPASSLNKRLLLKIILIEPAATVADSAYSPLTILITANQAPVASSVSIAGSLNVNEYLLGNYTYSDAEGNPEGNSSFEWWISSSATGTPSSIISGETSQTYKLRLSDQGKYLIFKVTPKALAGTTTGAQYSSSAYGRVNSAPIATNVTISNLPVYGNTLVGSFTFSDPDGEGAGVHTYRWLRDGLPIAGAVSDSYTLVPDDIDSKIIFEVTPVSSAGFPLIGLPVQSPETATVTDPTGDKPSASDLCISGTRSTGSVLTGKYTFSDPKFNEQNSKYFWFRGSSRVPLATSITYSVVPADMESELFFAVIPRNNKGVEGDTAFSQTLALINLPAETFSTGDPDVVLSATPGGGVFSGAGVISGKFSPSYVGEGGPYVINYLLNISLATKSCTQNASKDVYVNSVDAFFESFRNVYCHNGGRDTIYVTNVPAGATAKTFNITDHSAIVTQLSDTSLIIDPGMMRPGNKTDTLFFSYELDGSFYPISKPFVIDSVNAAISFANLDAAYCEESARRFITIQGIFPSGGTGVWTGDIVAEPTASTAFIDPTMGTPGNSYPVTYRYTSPLGCTTPSISRTVTINPLPDAGFPLNSTYNVDGPGEELVPVTPGGLFTGPGISGYTFYPSIAREGTHNITYSVTDIKGCRSDSTRTTEVKKAAGSITGINPGNQYCYDGASDALKFESTEPWITGVFSGPGIQDLAGGNATFTPSVAGKGDHTIQFAYVDFTFT